MSEPIIIVGASHAGISCADLLSTNRFSGDIDVIDRLDGLPLERPPLSKSYLKTGADEAAWFHLQPAEWFEKNRISLITGRSVVAIDPSNRSITFDDQTERTLISLSSQQVPHHANLDGLRAHAMLNYLRFHDFRHEAISRFVEIGLNMPEVAVISGHQDPRMLFRYTHLRAEDLLPKIN